MKKEDIVYEFLTREIYVTYMMQIKNFDCDVAGMNFAFKHMIDQKVTTILFFDIANDYSIVGYCSYRCSAVKIGGSVHSAVEIYSFAIDKRYQDKYFEDKSLCAAYLLSYCREKIEEISKTVIYAEYLILYAYHKRKVQTFYERNGFTACSSDYKTFRNSGE